MSFGQNTSDTNTTGQSYGQNYYDPDRAYMQQLMAYEMYGPEGTTGTSFGFFDPSQASNPMYQTMPSWDWARQPQGPPGNYGPTGGMGTGNGPMPSGSNGGVDNHTPIPGGPSDGSYHPPNGTGPENTIPTDQWGRPEFTGDGSANHPFQHNPDFNFPPSEQHPVGDVAANHPTDDGSGGVNQTAKAGSRTKQLPNAPDDLGNTGQLPDGGGSNPGYNGGNPNWKPGMPGGGPGNPGAANSFVTGQPGRGYEPVNLGTPPPGYGPMVRPGYGNNAPIYQTDGSGGWGSGGASGNAKLTGGQLYKSFSDMVANPDLDSKTKDAITVGANDAANAQYDSAQGALDHYGRVTGNRGGNAAATAQLAASRAGTAADVNRKNLIDFEQMRRQREAQGDTGLGALYNGENNRLGQLFGARSALDANPIGKNNTTSGSGNFVGSNFGFSIG